MYSWKTSMSVVLQNEYACNSKRQIIDMHTARMYIWLDVLCNGAWFWIYGAVNKVYFLLLFFFLLLLLLLLFAAVDCKNDNQPLYLKMLPIYMYVIRKSIVVRRCPQLTENGILCRIPTRSLQNSHVQFKIQIQLGHTHTQHTQIWSVLSGI